MFASFDKAVTPPRRPPRSALRGTIGCRISCAALFPERTMRQFRPRPFQDMVEELLENQRTEYERQLPV